MLSGRTNDHLRILLCTPFEQGESIVSGGINVWGKNILDYYSEIGHNNVDIDAISYDRHYARSNNSTMLHRIANGLIEYWHAIKKTEQAIKGYGPYNELHLCSSASLSLVKDWRVVHLAHKHRMKCCLHLHFGRIPEISKKNNWEWKLLHKVATLADSIIVMDKESYNTLEEHGMKNIYLLPNPLSMSIIRQINHDKIKIKHEPNKIVFVGHVISTKGVYELVEACRYLPEIELHLIGTVSKEIQHDLESIAEKRLNLHIRGELPHHEVIREMLSCEIFVLPTYTEGFPNVILEAMACECPIVTTDVGAIPEMLEEDGKQYGIMVKPKNPDQLREAILTMLQNKNIREECGRNARQRVIERYAMPKVWEQLLNIWIHI